VVIGVGRNRSCPSGGMNRCQLAGVKGGVGTLFVYGEHVGQGEIEQSQTMVLPEDELRRRSLRVARSLYRLVQEANVCVLRL
jgi:hypothetical protein